uniref:Trimethyllysine dioxygenase n=1 Tax=Pyrenophora seminiperda CCB06 TaxID=1302712 RepID=A0A3M7MAJ9_9PLEO|nr:trimethyllysine dioxygenase [Pyrenophora seminiperda CCB06]
MGDRDVNSPYQVNAIVTNAKTAPHRKDSVTVKKGKLHVGDKIIPDIWLRDNCQCSSCVHDATKQRLLDTFSIPEDISIQSHAWSKDDTALTIKWSDEHESTYSANFLIQAAANQHAKAVLRRGLVHTTAWDATIGVNPPKIDYKEVVEKDDAGLLRKLREYGFCYVDNTPFEDPDATQKLLETVAFIRETHYGGFYDFTADLASKDTAYTNIALEAHTDTTYFSDPAGLQAFHLLSHTSGKGGASLLVDGLKVAQELYDADRDAYSILSTVNVHAHASGNQGISIQPYRGFPVLEHDTATGELLRVRWNSSDRASIELPIEHVDGWYRAARKFDALLKARENEYWEQLTPGRVLIFDNWRVLHGRSSFTGKRRICGGYINRDDWISKFKMQTFGRHALLEGLAVS